MKSFTVVDLVVVVNQSKCPTLLLKLRKIGVQLLAGFRRLLFRFLLPAKFGKAFAVLLAFALLAFPLGASGGEAVAENNPRPANHQIEKSAGYEASGKSDRESDRKSGKECLAGDRIESERYSLLDIIEIHFLYILVKYGFWCGLFTGILIGIIYHVEFSKTSKDGEL